MTLIPTVSPKERWSFSKTVFSSDFVKYPNESLSRDSFQNPICLGMNND